MKLWKRWKEHRRKRTQGRWGLKWKLWSLITPPPRRWNGQNWDAGQEHSKNNEDDFVLCSLCFLKWLFFICPHLISTIEHNFFFQSWNMAKTRSMPVMISYFAPSASRNDPLPSWPTIGTSSPDSGIGRWKWWWFAAVAGCNTELQILPILSKCFQDLWKRLQLRYCN